ncbi:PilZ domain-containing protein [Reinekea blandensis]|uniref:PilZ domain-containing protein n=1 Tax=Reinekea blandensis MED297 TaxID=314283 RepID=A4BIQ2_9GAMM|nr:PilZ domain-containing protein [Reinekea blandensis]EAR08016.1 hypothetical protein MED297_15640 [Reinekea sp. MED297] [Reinekea blandensis MED297]
MGREKREHPRTPIQLTVELTFPNGDSLAVETWDISDGGIGINLPLQTTHEWQEGQMLSAQVKGLPMPAPKVSAEVVRVSDTRIGLKLST